MSAVGEGFAIWAAFTGTVAVVNTVKVWIQDFRKFKKEISHAGETLSEIELGFAGSQSSLEGWIAMWGFHEDVGKNYPRGLWGKKASGAITDHFKAIKNLHEDIRALLVPHASQKESFWKSVNVTQTAPEVLRKLDVIKGHMAFVREQSKDAFERKHQMQISPHQSRTILPLAWKKMFFELAYKSRITSKGFYDSCREAKKSFKSNHIKLEMDISQQVLNPNNEVEPTMKLELRYLILFPLQTGIQEFLVKGPLSSNENQPRVYDSFHRACLEALNNSGKQLFIFKSGGEEELFGSTVPAASMRIFPQGPVSGGEKLKTMLYDLHIPIAYQPANVFPLSERIRFAFKVAECGFFLCGTSWLVDLRSRNIRSIRDINQNRHFLLETEASRCGFEDTQYQQFPEHKFAIGVLLIEIGTGRSVEEFSKNSKNAEYTFSLSLAGTSTAPNSESKTMDEVLGILSRAIGVPYAESVKACLCHKARPQTFPAQLGEAYSEMLEDYYFNIYEPLKELLSEAETEFKLSVYN